MMFLRTTMISATAAVLFTAFTPMNQPTRDPLGQTAPYQLDKNAARTSSMISAGSAVATVDKFLPDHEQGPSYNVNLAYDVTVKLYGRQQGAADWAFTEEFFTPGFMEELRRTGAYETPDYKVKYEGQADVKTLDGTTYAKCDKIYIYDVKIPEGNNGLRRLLVATVGLNPDDIETLASVEDIKIRAHIYPGVPVLGAVKLDLSAKIQGFNGKAGFDFKRP